MQFRHVSAAVAGGGMTFILNICVKFLQIAAPVFDFTEGNPAFKTSALSVPSTPEVHPTTCLHVV